MSNSEVPEADALEQDEPLREPDEPTIPRFGVEIPEADAWEQSLPVPVDDEEDRR